ncbi:Na+/H+ antiporter subunit G [Staphylococcus borealis]|uniref:Na+/H+ antiporter subunit G n=1 Tax=Staphylococcus borealis TaxID=2742203 RepID=UPI0025A04BA1|nr:Na+/H+ antiporter subunit G [Staphylococcus borealis]MDM7864220.1 Na+/H+ antiporter subunit G [Staphylococcus borealis]
MVQINEIIELIAALLIFLGSIIAVISAIGIVKFQDVFLRSHASTKSSTLSVLLTLVGVLIYFTNQQSFFSVRLLLSIVFINLTSPVGMHLVARAAYRTGAYMYRKDDAPKRSSILLSSKEYNSTEELKNRARIREERREEIYYDVQKQRQKEKEKQQEENIESLSEARKETRD